MTFLDFVLIAAGLGALIAVILLALVGGIIVAIAVISVLAIGCGWIVETVADWLDKRKDPAS